jgi:hypothetical protein
MLKRSTFFAFAAFTTLAAFTSPASAQDPRLTDPRLYPFLGCWRSDTAGYKTARLGALTCVVPVNGTPDIEMINLVDGRIASRRRIEANSRPHSIEGQGCRGQERTSWSPLVRRIYLRAEYVCASTGIAGGSTTLFSFLPTGEWLEVENVRSGAGAILRVERRHDIGVPNGLPRELAGLIGEQRLAVVTARAEAASPLKTDDVIEAIRNSDTAVVRVWLLETAQNFQITSEQFASLTRAEVPAPILQAVMSAPPKYQLGVGVDANGRSTDAYLNTPGWGPVYPQPVSAYWAYYPYYRPYYPYYYGYARPYYCCYGGYPGYGGGYASSNTNVYVNNSSTSYGPRQNYGYGYNNNYGYNNYSHNGGYTRYTAPVYTTYRAPTYYNGTGLVAAPNGGQVHVIPASPGPVGRRP